MRIKGCTFKEEAFDKVPLEVEETLKREVLLSMKITGCTISSDGKSPDF